MKRTSSYRRHVYRNASETYMNGDVNVIVVSRVHVDGVKAGTGTIDDLQPLALLHRQVHKDRPVRQVCKRLVGSGGGKNMSSPQTLFSGDTHLEGHEFVIRFGRPRVHFHCILQRDHQELNPLIFH